MSGDGYTLFVNDERTVFVRVWDSGQAEVARRQHPAETWGPPVYLKAENRFDAALVQPLRKDRLVCAVSAAAWADWFARHPGHRVVGYCISHPERCDRRCLDDAPVPWTILVARELSKDKP